MIDRLGRAGDRPVEWRQTLVRADRFSVMLIPHTQAVTTLGFKKAGDPVNLEADMLAKHVAKLLGK